MNLVPQDHDERHRWMAMLLRASIAFQVRTIRLARDWSQETLAKNAGLSALTIGRVEDMSGEPPTMQTLLAIATAFDCALFCRFTRWDAFVNDMAGIIPPLSFEAEAAQTRPECKETKP